MRRSSPRGQMHLGAFFHPTGHHVASWLHPDAQADAGTNFRHYVQLAQMSEAAKFDLMFLADALAIRDGNLAALSRWPQYMAYFEPITLLSAIAPMTTHLGLAATATTSYNEPYNIARKADANAAAPTMPTPNPINAVLIPLTTTSFLICPGVDPSARRSPNSRVRCATPYETTP